MKNKNAKVFTEIDQLFDEMNKSQGFWKDTWYSIYYPTKRGLKFIRRIPLQFKWAYQKFRYGYSDRDWWNGDLYLAGVIAGIMEKIVDDGHGVAMSYSDDENTPIEVMVELRDAEWKKYIAIFREYSKYGAALNQSWKEEFGGVLDEDMQDALQWLSKHFQELWD
jgi:hypothetical protein